jgi:hypothetical protein
MHHALGASCANRSNLLAQLENTDPSGGEVRMRVAMVAS